MSRTSAAPQPPGDRLESIAVRLRTHEWVQDARVVESVSGAGREPLIILVVPAAAAVRTLRRRGKQSLVAAWQQHLRTAGLTGAARTPGVRHEPGTCLTPVART